MDEEKHPSDQTIFDADTWAKLPAILDHLPAPVRLTVWGDVDATYGEKKAAALCRTLADRFAAIRYRLLPRRANYPYYPVIGVMGVEAAEAEGAEGEIDFGVRLIGLPAGAQMTSLLTAIQAVAFRGMTLEPVTRIKLRQLNEDVNIELMTSAENEGGPIMAKVIYGLAVASSHVRSFLVMTDFFPEANLRYSINVLPHIVINSRVHIEGVVGEEVVLRHIAMAVGRN